MQITAPAKRFLRRLRGDTPTQPPLQSLLTLPHIVEAIDHAQFLFVQIGANDGITNDPLYPLIKPHWRGILCEPVNEYFESLSKLHEGNANLKLVKAAISDTTEQRQIYAVPSELCEGQPEWRKLISSLDPEHHRKSNTDASLVRAEEIQCVAWKEFCAHQSVDAIDLLLLDTEGHDYTILTQVLEHGPLPRVIFNEHGIRDGVMDAESLYSLVRRLTDLRYRIVLEGYDMISIRQQ